MEQKLVQRCETEVVADACNALYDPLQGPTSSSGFEKGLFYSFRQALFINSVQFNCETWHNIKDADFTRINTIDNQLL